MIAIAMTGIISMLLPMVLYAAMNQEPLVCLTQKSWQCAGTRLNFCFWETFPVNYSEQRRQLIAAPDNFNPDPPSALVSPTLPTRTLKPPPPTPTTITSAITSQPRLTQTADQIAALFWTLRKFPSYGSNRVVALSWQ
ncbi:MAG: hypothetical protein RMY34_32650 [Aulosira sp. DedQUE10]|nr:hypothetical protein [Aulosira sp. DedQUE10]